MEYKVSVIVPVYKVERYLKRCLDSLVCQSLDELQIIVVNDGSPDQSQSIINEFVQRFPNRVFSYEKPNGGLSDARNFGMQFTSGQYIGFIDSDDYVETQMFEKMYNAAVEEDADLVVCDILYEWENEERTMFVPGIRPCKNIPIQKAAFLSPLFAWNKLYRSDVFKQHSLKYPVGLWFEDIPVSVPMFSIIKRVVHVKEAFVHYVQRNNSIMSSFNSPKQADIFTILMLTKDELIRLEQLDEFKTELEYVFIEQLMLYGSFRFYQCENGLAWMRQAHTFIQSEFPLWKQNPYLSTLPLKYQIYLRLISRWNIGWMKKALQILKRRKGS